MAQKKGEGNKPNIAAVIHIGGNAVRLRICELKKGEIADIERLQYPLNIGHEVFSHHKISFGTIRELNKALSGFMKIISEYGVEEVRAVAASALRDAENRALVIDQLKIQSGIDVEVLENSVEKTLIYYKVSRSLKDAGILLPGRTLYAFVGSGTTGLALTEGDRVIRSQSMAFGALKLNDVILSIKEHTREVSAVAEELLTALFTGQGVLKKDRSIQNLVLSGSNLGLIGKLTKAENKGGVYLVPTKKIIALYEEMKNLRAYAAAAKFEISESAANLLYAVLTIYAELIRETEATEIILPGDTLIDSVMEQLLLSGMKKSYREYIRQNAVSCAKHLAESYACDEAQGEFLLKNATIFFDKLKKLHGLGATERLVLELAAILADCGKVVSARNYLVAGCDMVKWTEVYGITFRQRLLAANVVRFDEFETPNLAAAEFAALTNKEKTVISKLAAMFRLAKALDVSGAGKIQSVNIRVSDTEVVVTAEAGGNTFLEEWTFKNCAAFFKMVFGLTPVLRIKRRIPGISED